MRSHYLHSVLLSLGLAAGVAVTLPAMAAPGDHAITDRVKASLSSDSQLQDAHIRVRTEEGVVTLRGNVGTDEQRRDAERIARNIDGVQSVDNDISVSADEGEGHQAVARAERVGSDSWITTKVKSELVSNEGTHGFDVHVTTERGVVMLSGRVPDRHDLDRVRDVAAGVQGVRRVETSELHVSAGG